MMATARVGPAVDIGTPLWDMHSLGMVIHNLAGRIIDVNQRFARMLGYSVAEVQALDVDDVVHPDLRDRDAPGPGAWSPSRTRSMRIESKLVHRDGHAIWVRLHKTTLEVLGERCVLVCVDDWTTHHDELETLDQVANHDELTGVANRRGLLREAQRRLAEPGPQIALLARLHELGEVNRRFGHGVGDELVCAFAALLTDAIGDNAFVARVTGSEFVVLVAPYDASEFVRLVRAGVASGIETSTGQTIPLSVGFDGCCSRPGMSADDLVSSAVAGVDGRPRGEPGGGIRTLLGD